MRFYVELVHVKKELSLIPFYIVAKLQKWAEQVEEFGIQEVRRIPGYHDEPLKGNRRGERSIRLNRAYRAICKEISSENEIVIIVVEVNKHEY